MDPETTKGGRLLEIGCADGGVSELLARRVASLLALDVCEASIKDVLARRLPNVEAHVGLVESCEPEGCCEWIVMSEFLEHVRKPERLVTHALRWLAPGGRLLASSPEGQEAVRNIIKKVRSKSIDPSGVRDSVVV